MGLLFRGIVWFGVYVVLATLPLAVALIVDPFPAARGLAIEISVGLGLVAFALLAMQFALVSRLKAASRPFGTDALMQFHRQLGMVAVGFAVAHPLLLAGEGLGLAAWNPLSGAAATRTGAIAVWAAILIVATSLLRRRLRLSYGTWNSVHLAGALVVVSAMVWHVLSVSGYSSDAAMRAVLVSYAVLVLLLLLRYRVLRPALMLRRPWTVVENREEGGSTRTLRLRPAGHPGFAFEPGQFAWVGTGPSPFLGQQHPLTISSSAQRSPGGDLEFSVKALGDWSGTVVPGLSPENGVWVDGPYGVFTPERSPGQGLVLIAGGIGISPMRSILLTMRDRGDRRHVVLFYAANDMSRTVYRDELAALELQLDLDLIYVLEQPAEGWGGERGRLDDAMIRRHLPRHYPHYQFFVCGPVPMTDSVERMLTGIGVRADHIHTERFNMV